HGSGVIVDAGADRFPGRAVIAGHENVDPEVVAAMPVERRVRAAFVEARGDYAADVDALVRRHVLPRLASVARDLQVAVVGANVEKIAIRWRPADRRAGRPSLHAVIARDRVHVGNAAHDW